MAKYRIVQKGNLYSPQWKGIMFWNPYCAGTIGAIWVSKSKACAIIKDWETQHPATKACRVVHKPEDICGIGEGRSHANNAPLAK